jgi:threonine/homoserine/homoserine lactone efflux protein
LFEFSRFTLFVAASWVLIITPGPDMLYVISRGIAHGRRAGVLSAVGVVSGILVHTAVAAFGLAVLLQASAAAFLVVKLAGALYLIYLGVKSLRDKGTFELPGRATTSNVRALLWQGVLSNILNPKVAIFFLAFLPQFVNPESDNVPAQMILLGLTFALFGLCFLLVVGYTAGTLGGRFAHHARLSDVMHWISGNVLIALGMRLALPERK